MFHICYKLKAILLVRTRYMSYFYELFRAAEKEKNWNPLYLSDDDDDDDKPEESL